MMKRFLFPILIVLVVLLGGCNVNNPDQPKKTYFTLWNNCEALTAAFMLVADDDARDHADLAEGARREAKWREAGYHIISMKNDFKTIYGYGVEKTDFIFE